MSFAESLFGRKDPQHAVKWAIERIEDSRRLGYVDASTRSLFLDAIVYLNAHSHDLWSLEDDHDKYDEIKALVASIREWDDFAPVVRRVDNLEVVSHSDLWKDIWSAVGLGRPVYLPLLPVE